MIRLILLGVLVSLTLPALAQVSVFPLMPKALETVRVRLPAAAMSGLYNSNTTQITMSGNKVTVELGQFDVLPPPATQLDWPLGQFPAGSYEVEVRSAGRSLGSTSFSVAPRQVGSIPLWNHTDLWWNPDESGWGLNVIQHPSGIIFATWFVYADDGRPAWYVIPEGSWLNATQYSGPVYRTSGPVVAQTFNPATVTRTLVGSAMLSFASSDFEAATIVITADGRTVTRSVRRQGF